MLVVSVVLGDAAGCGGRVMVADCGEGRQYCSETNVCCPNFTTCGDGKNGCSPGDCCLNTTSHVVDGGTDGPDALAPVELPPDDMAPPGSSDPTDPNGPGGGNVPRPKGAKQS
jgi:hypothetical protein